MRRFGVVAAMAAILLVIGGIAVASIPGPDGVIHACYKTSNPAQGALIAIDSAASCPNGYAALNWNQTGPQGPAGTNGVAGWEVVSQRSADVPPGLTGDTVANCPTGKKVTGGGYGSVTIGGLYVTSNAPSDGGGGWQVVVLNQDSGPHYYYVYAICATVN
jgi:hypothetical protein